MKILMFMESMVPEERVTPLRMGLMIQVFPPVLHRGKKNKSPFFTACSIAK
jgi:hypothetical protein